MIWHQWVCSLWSSHSFICESPWISSCVLTPFPYFSSFSFHPPPLLCLCTTLPLVQTSSSMRRQSWSSTWSRSRSSKWTSWWKRSRRWRMKPSQSSWPLNRYGYCGRARTFRQEHFSIQCGTTYPRPSALSYGNSVRCQKFTILNSSHWILAGKNILVCGWIKPVCFEPLHIFFHALMGGFFCGSAWIHLLLLLTHEYLYVRVMLV